MYKTGISAGGLFAGLGVVLGAFGAHALGSVLPEAQMQIFETGVRYQMYHSFALLIAGGLAAFFPVKWLRWAIWFFITGIFLFSGSLYLMTYLKVQGQVGLGGLGLITPIGGLFFILGWVALVLSAFRLKVNS